MTGIKSEIIVRLDDVGLADWRTHAVISTFVNGEIPLSCQVIPASLSTAEAFFLNQMAKKAGGLLELCQHGWQHSNHAPSGERKFEFGSTRSKEEQTRDIRSGLLRLKGELGLFRGNVFTPPHDRLDSSTLESLAALGFQVVAGGPRTFEGLNLPPGMVAFGFDVDASVRIGENRITREVSDVMDLLYAHPGPRVGLVLHAAEMVDLSWCMNLVTELRRLSTGGVKFRILRDLEAT